MGGARAPARVTASPITAGRPQDGTLMDDIATRVTAGDVRTRVHQLHFEAEGLDTFLEQLAVLAADSVDADASCGVTLVRESGAVTVAPSDERTTTLDELQYAQGDGPCLEAARSGEVVLVPDVSRDDRWPAYREHATARGLHAVLSIPLHLGDEMSGALNLYAFEPHTFDEDERVSLEHFGEETSRAISLAVRHDMLTRQKDHLHSAMASRRVIDQALGIVMAQNRCSADEAFGILRRASNNRNVKIQKLAADMIRSMTGSEPSTDIHWRP